MSSPATAFQEYLPAFLLPGGSSSLLWSQDPFPHHCTLPVLRAFAVVALLRPHCGRSVASPLGQWLSRRWLCPQEAIWQSLETFLTVMPEDGGCCYWHLAARDQGSCSTSSGAQEAPALPTKNRLARNARSAKAEKLVGDSEWCPCLLDQRIW